MTNIIVNEKVFAYPRKLVDKWFPYSMLNNLVRCPTCMGFWVGLFLALVFPQFELNWFLAGCISSGTNKIVLLTLYKF